MDGAVERKSGNGSDARLKPAERFVSLFGIAVADTTLNAAADWVAMRARHGLKTDVAFLNAHCVNTLYRDAAYRRSIDGMDRVFADGAGMRIAARVQGIALVDNVNGTDLFPEVCARAAADGTSLYLLGAAPGTAAEAGRRMQQRFPGLQIAGNHHGFIADPAAEARVIEAINASSASILLVAMGVPLQEAWIERNRHRLSVPVVLAVGGLFDYYSGRIPRAPLALRRMGLEWAWRLAQEPRRLARRYLLGNAEFLARMAWHRFAQKA